MVALRGVFTLYIGIPHGRWIHQKAFAFLFIIIHDYMSFIVYRTKEGHRLHHSKKNKGGEHHHGDLWGIYDFIELPLPKGVHEVLDMLG